LLTSKAAAAAVIQPTDLSLIDDLGFSAATRSDDPTDLEAPAAIVLATARASWQALKLAHVT
jgi:hypothetical protein